MEIKEYFRHKAFLGFKKPGGRYATHYIHFTIHCYNENEGAPKPLLHPSVLINK